MLVILQRRARAERGPDAAKTAAPFATTPLRGLLRVLLTTPVANLRSNRPPSGRYGGSDVSSDDDPKRWMMNRWSSGAALAVLLAWGLVPGQSPGQSPVPPPCRPPRGAPRITHGAPLGGRPQAVPQNAPLGDRVAAGRSARGRRPVETTPARLVAPRQTAGLLGQLQRLQLQQPACGPGLRVRLLPHVLRPALPQAPPSPLAALGVLRAPPAPPPGSSYGYYRPAGAPGWGPPPLADPYAEGKCNCP